MKTQDNGTGATVIDTPEGISMYRFCARKGALGLEIQGMRRSGSGRTAYSICKSEYGLTGSREIVLAAMNRITKRTHSGVALQDAIDIDRGGVCFLATMDAKTPDELNRDKLIDCRGHDHESAAIDALRLSGTAQFRGKSVLVLVGKGSNRLNLPCIWEGFTISVGEQS